MLDLLVVFGMSDLYELVANDFRAVQLMPQVLHIPDDQGQYLRDGSAHLESNVPYPEEGLPVDGWKLTAHHRLVGSYALTRYGRSWDHVAVAAVLRDRMFLPSVRALLASRGC